ncbi:MAG: Minf_1886 family protein [Planctomycetota bacterium]
MIEPSFYELAKRYPCYPPEAYEFVDAALKYACDGVNLDTPAHFERATDDAGEPTIEEHFSGQQLCEVFRRYAINQFGYLAKVVLKTWNVRSTQCFGDLVYNMIDFGILKKSEQDSREDFDHVYDFDLVFQIDVDISSSTVIH